MKKKINKIVNKYGVNCLSAIYNIQGTLDVELDKNIYYKEQEKMEKKIRDLGQINDIYYRDIA